jgi:hypothetical protein
MSLNLSGFQNKFSLFQFITLTKDNKIIPSAFASTHSLLNYLVQTLVRLIDHKAEP